MTIKKSRRAFLSTTATSVAVLGAPAVLGASRLRSSQPETVIGEGDFQYKVDHKFAQLPEKFRWQTTHGVAVDSENNLYVVHEGRTNQKNHPSIFVFDETGKYIRSFGSLLQGGGHGIEVRKEGNEEFIYVAAYKQVKAFLKMTLKGEIVWYRRAPMESRVYKKGENVITESRWARNAFLPTNFAFLDDGGFLLVDGYGSYRVHRYDKDANWISCFGKPGKGKGTFNLPHGLWVDKRSGREPSIVVADRVHNTLQYFSLDGEYVETVDGFALPANVDVRENLMLVPELKARLTLLNEENEVVARLGDGSQRLESIENLRGQPKKWQDGEFVHPHDACFDQHGNIIVAEWVGSGRLTKLSRVG